MNGNRKSKIGIDTGMFYGKVIRGRVRMHTCKIIIVTSLVWLIIDVFLLMHYTDCIAGWSCSDGDNNELKGVGAKRPREVEHVDARRNEVDRESEEDSNSDKVNPVANKQIRLPPAEDSNDVHDSGVGGKLINNLLEKPGYANEDDLVRGKQVQRLEDGFKYAYPDRLIHRWHAPDDYEGTLNSPGELGKPVTIPKHLEPLMKEKFKLNQFNLLVSDMIALNRTLPDYRMDGCKNKIYAPKLPRTSIVIVFHNEAWSTLLRTIHSIILRSPRELIEEIVLVDDASERDYLGTQLEEYVAKLQVPVKVYRMPERSGLIRARLTGAAKSTGQVITFLDAHCECTKGWLEPLLAQIAEDRTRVVCPIIDVISDETFEYITASDMTWGGFNWKLNFRWYRVPQRELDRRGGDRTLPLRTPTMAGGLFSIDRDYFEQIGTYDEGMDIWGGENLEMSFRVWQCGGTVYIHPCSRVGHVFRDKSPYSFPGGTQEIVLKNSARVAEVWMDDWKEFYYQSNPAAKTVDIGDVAPRRELRSKLQCKSFRWYLETIYPESQMPLDYHYLGDVRNHESQLCLDTMGRKAGDKVGIGGCHGLGGNQVFAYTKRQQIMSDDNCLDAAPTNGPVKLIRCHGLGGNQAWTYNQRDYTIRHHTTGKCLDKPHPADPSLPVLKKCDNSSGQKWILKGHFKWQAS